jgi:UDP-N-acetylglucosamine--N-acetylmuramyl-(pentapeptide) pyrophosphoryl-undecaprenol N-acetylglucosamine transferase
VEKLFIPYEESRAFYASGVQGKLEVSGNPVRSEFLEASASKGRTFLNIKEGEPILLVLGGSSGSLEINRLIQESLPELVGHYTVVHQCGNKEGEVPASQDKYKPYAYFREEMPHIIAAADLIICRGGAGTIWECAALHKPMVIIPLRGGSRGDQVENARIFENAGAAINFCDGPYALPSGEPSAEKLSALVAEYAADENRMKTMAASKISGTDATDYIAEILARKTREK